MPGQRVRALPRAKPLLGQQSPPGVSTSRQNVLRATSVPGQQLHHDIQNAVRGVVGASSGSRSGATAAGVQARLPTVASRVHVPDEALEIEGRADWWTKRKRKTPTTTTAEPAADMPPLGTRVREFLDNVEMRIAEAKSGLLGKGIERRQVLATIVDGAADAGFLVTLGQTSEQLRAFAEQPEDPEIDQDWNMDTLLNLSADARLDADMLTAFLDELLSSDEELTDYRRMISEMLAVRQQELRREISLLPVESAAVDTVADHCTLIELAGVYVDQGRLGAIVELLSHLSQIAQVEDENDLMGEEVPETCTATSDIDEIAAYINETENRWQELQMEMLEVDPTIFDRNEVVLEQEQEQEEQVVDDTSLEAKPEASNLYAIELAANDEARIGPMDSDELLRGHRTGLTKRRLAPKPPSGQGAVARSKKEIAVKEQGSVEDLQHLVDASIDAIPLAQREQSAQSMGENAEMVAEETDGPPPAVAVAVEAPTSHSAARLEHPRTIVDADSAKEATEGELVTRVPLVSSVAVLPTALPSAPIASTATVAAKPRENGGSGFTHVFEVEGSSQAPRIGAQEGGTAAARIGAIVPASGRSIGGVKGWTKATPRAAAQQSNQKKRQRKLVPLSPAADAAVGPSARVDVPQWWLELKATICGAATTAAETETPSVGLGSGIVLGHRRLRSWATQLCGARKVDEDALSAAVAWMEEQGGVLVQLSKGAALSIVHGSSSTVEGGTDPDPGPYYRLPPPDQVRYAATKVVETSARAPLPNPAPYALGRYPSAGVGPAETPMAQPLLSPRLAASGASAAERAGRRAEQQLLRERSAQLSESRSLDRAINDVYGAISERSPRWQQRQTAGGFR